VTDPAALLAEFQDRGVVRIDRAFDRDAAARMGDVVWRYAARKAGLRRDDRSTWPIGRVPISWKGIRRNRALDALLHNPAVEAALGTVFDPTGWQSPKPGAQVLFTVPGPGPWAFPGGWHMDCGFEAPTWPVPAVKVFGFFGDVGPCGGGTLLLAGSHHLVGRYRSRFDPPPSGGNVNWHPFLRRHPPLGDLLTASARPDRGRSLVAQRFDVDGVPIEVLELRGQPGDVVITHLHVFHSSSPNTSDRPREMVANTVLGATTAASDRGVLQEAVPHREEARRRPIRRPDLGVDVLDVVRRRLGRDDETLGDLLVGLPTGEQPEHVDLTRGETGGPVATPADPVPGCP
jgi:hypothetical protein